MFTEEDVCMRAHSCPTLCNPMDCSSLGFYVPGILQTRIMELVAISFSRVSSRPRDRTQVSHIAGTCFTLWATREVLPNRKLRQFIGCFFLSFLPEFKSDFNFYHNISSWWNNWAHFLFHFSSSLCWSFSFLAFLRKDWPTCLSCYSREPTTYPGAHPSVNKKPRGTMLQIRMCPQVPSPWVRIVFLNSVIW